MPERAQHIPPPPPLDEQVDQLLADAATNDEAVNDAAPTDDDHDFASPDQLLDDVNASMQALESEAVAAADAEVRHLAAAVADASAPADRDQNDEPVAESQDPAAPAVATSPSTEVDFASPDAIRKLDEKLAASAQELSDHAAGAAVDEQPAPEPVAAATAPAVDDAALAADTEADAEAGAHVEPVAEPAAAQPSPGATTNEPAPAPAAAAAPVPAAQARPDPGRATPQAGAPAPAPAAPAAPAVEKVVSVAPAPRPAARRYSAGRVLAAPLVLLVRPIAGYTSRLSPTVRQTIGYAAIITVFQAACLWGFLIFRGPPVAPAPTGEGTVLRRVGDDAEHDARAKAQAAHAKPAPKPAAKGDTKAKTAKKDSHGGH